VLLGAQIVALAAAPRPAATGHSGLARAETEDDAEYQTQCLPHPCVSDVWLAVDLLMPGLENPDSPSEPSLLAASSSELAVPVVQPGAAPLASAARDAGRASHVARNPRILIEKRAPTALGSINFTARMTASEGETRGAVAGSKPPATSDLCTLAPPHGKSAAEDLSGSDGRHSAERASSAGRRQGVSAEAKELATGSMACSKVPAAVPTRVELPSQPRESQMRAPSAAPHAHQSPQLASLELTLPQPATAVGAVNFMTSACGSVRGLRVVDLQNSLT
jgi:hypothetical protein